MSQFNLLDYLDEIQAIADNNNCTVTAAVDRMIVNLNTFNEHHKGTGKLNYHILSNQWGELTSADKITQKREAKERMLQASYPATTRRRNTRRT